VCVLTPQERSTRARIAALELHARVDSREHTEAARAKSPGQLDYWRDRVDPDGQLDRVERDRRAELKRRAHFQRLALASARSRRAKSTGRRRDGDAGAGDDREVA